MARLKPVRSSRLSIEPLEDRWLPANLTMTGIDLLDGAGTVVASPTIGGQYRVRARWSTDNLTTSDSYIVRIAVDGVALDSTQSGVTGTGLAFNLTQTGWYAASGSHTVTVTLDAGSAITETTELDNIQSVNFTPSAPVGLPAGLFQWPIAGTSGKDWSIVNYNDVDPRSGTSADFRGGPFVYDGHDAFDITLPNFAKMDAGVQVFAAGGGTITDIVDDQFDRDTSTPAAHPGNHITIDHGNGWSTTYYHIGKFSATVGLGDVVVAGQPIALVGSSGNSTDAHLHFAVRYNGLPVEAMDDPSSYFAVPPTYEGDQAVSITDWGLTNSNPSIDIKERPDEISTFTTASTQFVWFKLNHANLNDVYQVQWYTGAGTLFTSSSTFTAPATLSSPWLYFNTGLAGFANGTWQAAITRNGVELVRKSFTIAAAGAPEIHVSQGSTYILSGRTTPIDFGSVASGSVGPQIAFTIQNVGTATFSTSGLQLPPGFSPVSAFPSSITAGSSANFTVRLDSAVVGTKSGAIRFTTTDSDESTFWFSITGVVNGTPASGSPTLTESSAYASVFKLGSPALLIAPNATLTDANSPVFNGGSVSVRFLRPVTGADVLSVRNEGTLLGQIGLSGTAVTFSGVNIGTLSGGNGTDLTILLGSSATLTAVQALLRNLTFSTTSLTTSERRLGIQVTDNTGLVSDTVYRTILPMQTADVLSIVPVNPNPTPNPVSFIDVNFGGNVDASTFTIADLSLIRNGGSNLINAGVSIASQGAGLYRVNGLSSITTLSGAYVFTVNGTTIRTAGGIPGSTSVSTSWDNVPLRPTVTIARGPVQPGSTNQSPVRFVVTFSEAVTGFDNSDITFGAGTLTTGLTATVTPNGGSGTSYFVDVGSISGTGTVGIVVVDSAASSVSGGLSQAASTPPAAIVTFDNVPPAPSLSPVAFGPTNQAVIPVTLTFSESVAGLLSTEIQVSNATMTDFTPVGTTQFTFNIHPTTEGAFSITVPAGAAQDGFSNDNTAIASAGVYDITAPTVAINRSGTQGAMSNNSTLQFIAVFSEPVATLDPSDIDFAGTTTPGALNASISGSGTTFTVDVTGMTGDGLVQVAVKAAATTDPAGNANTVSTGANNTVVYDKTAPTVTINQAAGQPDAVAAGPVVFTAVFNEPVTGFDGSDILFTGSTVGGNLVATVIPITTSVYTVSVSGMAGDGLVAVAIAAGAAQDGAGNLSIASTSTDPSVRFDNVAPSAVIAQASGQKDPTSNSPVEFTITFSEPISGFDSADFDFTNSSVGGFLIGAITGTGPTYTITVTGMTGVGDVVLNLPANRVTDQVGNGNTAATGADRQVSFFTITVAPFLLSNGVVGTAYNALFTAGGHPSGNVPYGYSISAGTLPPGLMLSSTGTLSGTPGTDGTFDFTVQAITAEGDTGIRAYTVVIAPAPIQLTIGGRGDGSAFQYSPDENGTYVLTSVVKPIAGATGPMRTAVGDIDGDGVPDTIFVTGPGMPLRISATSGKDNKRIVLPFDPFGGDFTGGGYLASADLDGDGRAEFVVTPDRGGGPRVSIFSLQPNGDVRVRGNFFGIDDPAFRGGARPALGDVNRDGTPDLLVAAGFGGGPRIALYDGATLLTTRAKLVNDFFAFPEDAARLRNGVFAALGDISGDGYADLIFGGGPGGAPRVYILSGQLLLTGSPNLYSHPIANFFVDGNQIDRGGIHVAAKDADLDNKLDLVIGSGEGVRSRARIYLGADFNGTSEPGIFQDLDPYQGAILADGVYVG